MLLHDYFVAIFIQHELERKKSFQCHILYSIHWKLRRTLRFCTTSGIINWITSTEVVLVCCVYCKRFSFYRDMLCHISSSAGLQVRFPFRVTRPTPSFELLFQQTCQLSRVWRDTQTFEGHRTLSRPTT